MREKKLLLWLMIFAVIGCSKKDDIQPEAIKLDGYLFQLMHYSRSVLSSPSDLVTFDYDMNNRIIRRNGGVYDSSLDPSTGYRYMFSDKIYDELTYDGNKIIIEKKSTSPNIDPSIFKRTYIMNDVGKIIQKTIETSPLTPIEIIYYEYNLSGQLFYSSSEGLNYSKESHYLYNTNSNLKSIITQEYDEQMTLTRKVSEEFFNFDDSKNSIQNLMIFEEVFNRTLSKNNYSKYTITVEEYGTGGFSSHGEYFQWTFQYDENGNILFNTY